MNGVIHCNMGTIVDGRTWAAMDTAEYRIVELEGVKVWQDRANLRSACAGEMLLEVKTAHAE